MLSPILFVIRELYRRHSYLARRLNSLQNCSKLNSAHVHGLKMKSLRLKIAALLEGWSIIEETQQYHLMKLTTLQTLDVPQSIEDIRPCIFIITTKESRDHRRGILQAPKRTKHCWTKLKNEKVHISTRDPPECQNRRSFSLVRLAPSDIHTIANLCLKPLLPHRIVFPAITGIWVRHLRPMAEHIVTTIFII